MGWLERWIRKRAVGEAELLAQAELKVSRPDVLTPEAAVSQEWHVDGDDRAWIEPFMLVAYATKQVSNFRGDTALGVWLSMTGQAGGATGYQIVDSVDEPGTYGAQVFQREGQPPFIQTPASGGSDEFRNVEVAGTVRALMKALGRNGPDSAGRVEAAMEAMATMGQDFGDAPSLRGANELTWSVMHVLEQRGTVPPLGVVSRQ